MKEVTVNAPIFPIPFNAFRNAPLPGNIEQLGTKHLSCAVNAPKAEYQALLTGKYGLHVKLYCGLLWNIHDFALVLQMIDDWSAGVVDGCVFLSRKSLLLVI